MLQFKADPSRTVGSGSLTMSSAGKCGRAVGYNYRGYPKTFHPHIPYLKRLLTFKLGDALHDEFRLHLANLLSAEEEVFVPLPSGVTLKGRHDGTVADPETGEVCLLEIKTMNPFAYKRFVASGELDAGYYYQMQLYMYALNLQGEAIRRCVYVAIDKGSSEWFQRFYDYEPEAVPPLLEALDAIARAERPEDVERHHAPDKDGELPWQCVYCDFWQHCWPQAEPYEAGGKPKLRVPADSISTSRQGVGE